MKRGPYVSFAMAAEQTLHALSQTMRSPVERLNLEPFTDVVIVISPARWAAVATDPQLTWFDISRTYNPVTDRHEPRYRDLLIVEDASLADDDLHVRITAKAGS